MPGRVERIELWHVSVPLPRPFWPSWIPGYPPRTWSPRWRAFTPAATARPDGTVAVPQEPGLGVHIDERLLRRFGRRFHVSTPLRVAVRTVRHKGLSAAITLKRAKAGGVR